MMDTPNSLKDQKERPRYLTEVTNIEKQLWALIHAKGVLHSDFHASYRKVCSSYEKIILNDHGMPELQDIEYSLWKLHYRNIDEFRKRIKRTSDNEEAAKAMAIRGTVDASRSNDDHVEGFKLFLLESSRFYQNLVMKIKKLYGFPEDLSIITGNSVSVEPKKMQKLQFICHRFLVCLGDLARYREQCEKSDLQKQDWSVAVAHYLEATKIWPHSGNPQNQLAVLATYVGDEFLALYHCVRSLAVREPFPDAWNNLILLFERNKSSPLQSLFKEFHFDVLNPSESTFSTNSLSSKDTSNCNMVQDEHEGSKETHLWPLFIRMISFFFIKSSLDDFPCTLASTLRELDILMTLDDTKLKAAVESYQRMDSARSGPFRTLQAVSIFIFAIEHLMNNPEAGESKNKNDSQLFELTREALTAAFVFMGRLAKRCMKANFLDSCPLLPALLVFSEWLVGFLDRVESYISDEKSRSAILDFFNAFLRIIKQINSKYEGEGHVTGSIVLWEDYELRGFAPLACSYTALDFSAHWAHSENHESGSEWRAHRLINAAMKIADGSRSCRKWICYDKSGGEYYVPESNKFPQTKENEVVKSHSTVVEVKESDQHIHKMTRESQRVDGKTNSSSVVVSNSVATEDEEVILFKPLTRHNSAPLDGAIMLNDQKTSDDTTSRTTPTEECFRRATSMLIAQNQGQADPSAFHSDANGHPLSEASISSEPAFTFSTSASAGPPSLNAWVFNDEYLNNDRMKGIRDVNKHSMPPIEEVACTSLNHLSIRHMDNSIVSSRHESVIAHNPSAAYAAPLPSAPFLPDEAVWFNCMQSNMASYSSSENCNKTNNFYEEAQVSGYSDRTGFHQPLDYGVRIPGFVEGSPIRRMTSSEWLRQYRENHDLEWNPTHVWPATNAYAAVNTGNVYSNDISRSGLFEQYGVPLSTNPLIYEESPPLHSGFPPAYGIVEHRREKFYHGYQRPSPYGCGVANESEPLLQYLKEKEWLLQQGPTFRGPTFMGN